MKKLISVSLVAVVLLALGGITFASGFDGPADTYSKLADISVEEAYQQRGIDKTFGQLAEENGFFEEFRNANLEYKKAILEEKVEEGVITQEQAEEIIKAMEEGCTLEPGTNRWGQEYGLCFGTNYGNQGIGMNGANGQGLGKGRGYGQRRGNGRGFGFSKWNEQ
ncbi:DUF2680 domain-containing protein [Sporosalibacterium faouarense]|uniref:DUF2680 domain-containing protein n=1 Tax=Sporosalibacterium faouarense TaxID=516123 RepID=UPI00141C4E85|nr:DUF2680 domain-containing protein [Sporosalibacterium faouarense]MTI47369.1 DUF2680 domain-containing protein [Bacillota bacterium]